MKRLMLMALTGAMLVSASGLANAGTIEDIQARGKFICGVKDSVVPFGFIDEATSQLVGFDIDMCQAVADKLGVPLELKSVTSATRIPMLTQGSIDLIAATMTHQFARDEVIDFSITYFDAGQRLLVKKDGGINSVADLAGKKVASVKGSTSEKNVKAAAPESTVVSFDEYPQAFLALKQGKVVAVTTDEPILVGLKNSDPNPAEWEVVGPFIASEPYALGMIENDSDWRDFVNKTLADMWTSGEYQKAYDKWFGPDTAFYIPLQWNMEVWP